MLGRDGIAGLVCLALSLGLFVLTFGLPPAVMVPVGPAFYPRVVILIFGLLSAILIALDVRAMQRRRASAAAAPAAATSAGPAPNYPLVLATFIEFGLYIVADAAGRLPHFDLPVRARTGGHAGMAAQQQALGLGGRSWPSQPAWSASTSLRITCRCCYRAVRGAECEPLRAALHPYRHGTPTPSTSSLFSSASSPA